MRKKYERKETIVTVDYAGKAPPSSIDLEEVVLGTIILDYHLIPKFPYLKPEVFYEPKNAIIYQALLDLYSSDKKPDLMILTDYLNNSHLIDKAGGVIYITQLISKQVGFIDNYVKVIVDKYHYREFIKFFAEGTKKAFDAIEDPIDIAEEYQQKILDLVNFDGDVQNNFLKSLELTINSIKSASAGENMTVIKSGYEHLDKSVTFRTGYICIIAGPEGSGKTKMVTALVRGMLENEENIAVQWFSMEDNRQQIIRSFLSMDLKKTTKELQSINYKMSDKDIKEVEDRSDHYKEFTIEFYDRIASIQTIITRTKRFADKYRDRKKVIIIDNLGLIDCDKTGIERDDFIAGKIKDIADGTNCFIFLIHHFTKEISRKQNLDDGYRPRKEYLKGSTRILDFVQQALFVNLPRKYPDLLSAEKQTELTFISSKDIEFTENNFDKHLWSINSTRDNDTKAITDLRIETFVKLRSLLNNKVNDLDGKTITFSDIIQKYTEYSNSIDLRNKGQQEERYKTKKASIYSFIVKRMFNENYSSNPNSPRSQYLYGHNSNLRYHIDDLFIVEAIKNRDDDNLGDNTIFRFICDLGYNTFNEVKNDGTFK